MTNSLYTEALADAKAVREAAEARAKQQLIEAMSPDIKLMVEKAILDEEIDDFPLETSISFAAASAVPPVAIKSSIMRTESFCEIESL